MKLKDYIKLYLLFFKIGLFTFGGGYSMLSIISSECIDKRNWMTSKELLDMISIAESTPGPVSTNTATFVGNKRGGLLGGIIATLGAITPSIIIICIVASFYEIIINNVYIEKILGGIIATVIVLIIYAAIKLAKGLKGSGNLLINILFIVITVLLKAFSNILSIYLIIAGAILGFIIYSFLLIKKEEK